MILILSKERHFERTNECSNPPRNRDSFRSFVVLPLSSQFGRTQKLVCFLLMNPRQLEKCKIEKCKIVGRARKRHRPSCLRRELRAARAGTGRSEPKVKAKGGGLSIGQHEGSSMQRLESKTLPNQMLLMTPIPWDPRKSL